MSVRDRVVLLLQPASDDLAELRDAARGHGFGRFVEGSRGRLRGSTLPRPTAIQRVSDPGTLGRLLRRTAPPGPLVLRWGGDRVIPLESALAERRPELRLWVVAEEPAELPGALGALERGADAVVVRVARRADLDRLERVLGPSQEPRPDWRWARVDAVEPMGLADRVLVDTLELLGEGRGLLVGSAAAFLFLVESETAGSAFSRPRPFRVNAGSPHSYVLRADGTTAYLSELAAGDALLAAGPGRAGSTVRVGRLKIERRPMVMVRAEAAGASRTLFVQEAETVRLLGERAPIAVTALARGDRVRGARLPAARHLGTAIAEQIEER